MPFTVALRPHPGAEPVTLAVEAAPDGTLTVLSGLVAALETGAVLGGRHSRRRFLVDRTEDGAVVLRPVD